MANPTSATAHKPLVLLATTTEQVVTLDPRYEYTLSHDGEDDDGVESTSTIYCAMDSTSLTATPAEGDNKLKLRYGMSVVISRTSSLRFAIATGASEVTFTLMRAAMPLTAGV